MLDVVYYPVSAILLVWHTVLGAALGPAAGLTWALAVILLVCTLRALLIKPFVAQMRSMRTMARFRPQITTLRERHKGDRQRLAEEMQKLNTEHGVSPLGGCLPMLVQVPVFLGLLGVLHGFVPGAPGNYLFSAADVASFLDADLLGSRLSESVLGGAQTLAHVSVTHPVLAPHVLPLAVPLLLVAAVATHVNARLSRARQTGANPQAAAIGRLTVWAFPLGVLVAGAFFPVAMLLYWVANNGWTLGQTYLVDRRLDREEQAVVPPAWSAPRPGQRPAR